MAPGKKVILEPSFFQEVAIPASIACTFLAILLFGSFVPYTAESFDAALFFVLFSIPVVLLLWLPLIFTNTITVEDGVLSFRAVLLPWKTEGIALGDITKIDIRIIGRRQSLVFTRTSSIELTKHIFAWDEVLIANLLHLARAENPRLQIPEKYRAMVENFENKEAFEQKRIEYQKRERVRVYVGFLFALALILALVYFEYRSSDSVTAEDFGDVFVSAFELFLR